MEPENKTFASNSIHSNCNYPKWIWVHYGNVIKMENRRLRKVGKIYFCSQQSTINVNLANFSANSYQKDILGSFILNLL